MTHRQVLARLERVARATPSSDPEQPVASGSFPAAETMMLLGSAKANIWKHARSDRVQRAGAMDVRARVACRHVQRGGSES
jgi:hypothetical protein